MKNLSKDDVNWQPKISSPSKKKEMSKILIKEPLTGFDLMPS